MTGEGFHQDWRLEKQGDNGDLVQVRLSHGKKIFKQQPGSRQSGSLTQSSPATALIVSLQGSLQVSPARLMEELYYGLENLPARNPTMEEARLVQVVDHFTDITHHPPGLARADGSFVTRHLSSPH